MVAKRYSKINTKLICVADKKSGNRVRIRYDNKKFIFQSPYLKVIESLRSTNCRGLSQITTSYEGINGRIHKKYLSKINEIEDEINEQVSVKGMQWFSSNDITSKTMVKSNDDGDNYTDWPFRDDDISYFDEDNNKVDDPDINVGDYVKIIVSVSDVFIGTNTFGTGMVAKKIMVKKLQEDSDDEDYGFCADGEDSVNSGDDENNMLSLMVTERNPNTIRRFKVDDKINIDDIEFVDGDDNDGIRNIESTNNSNKLADEDIDNIFDD